MESRAGVAIFPVAVSAGVSNVRMTELRNYREVRPHTHEIVAAGPTNDLPGQRVAENRPTDRVSSRGQVGERDHHLHDVLAFTEKRSWHLAAEDRPALLEMSGLKARGQPSGDFDAVEQHTSVDQRRAGIDA